MDWPGEEAMFEISIDRDMYDHPGKQTTMTRAIRKHRDLPALTAGQTVTIVRMTWRTDRYGSTPRVLVRTETGAERWVDGSDIEPISGRNPKMYERLGEIAADFFAVRD